jgi:hypothetical protein
MEARWLKLLCFGMLVNAMSRSEIVNNTVLVCIDSLERATTYISIALSDVQIQSLQCHVALRLHYVLFACERKSLAQFSLYLLHVSQT